MLRANIFQSQNYQGEDFSKLTRALGQLESTLNGDRFRMAILEFKTFQFVSYKCLFSSRLKTYQLQEYTNEQVYQKLMDGHRSEGGYTFMDLKLQLSERKSLSAVGMTDRNNRITTYRAKFNQMDESELASHLAHEWTHTLGFEHSYRDSCDDTRNCLTVPYAIGNIVEIILTGKCYYGCQYETLNK